MSTTRLLTFGAGNSRYRRAARRVAREARATGLFSRVEAITDSGLRRHHAAFVQQNDKLLSRDVRGFGYWLWKPYLIDAALQSPSVDYLVYLDAGSVLNLASAHARQRFAEYHQLADAQGLMVMHNKFEEQAWCKADTLERIGVPAAGRSTNQAEAGFVVLKNSPFTRDLVRSWLDLCCEANYRYLDDSPSQRPNATAFNEHRHDQAILSGLCKVAGIEMIADECTIGTDAPVWNARHRWGSRFDPTGKASFARRMEERVERVENWRADRRAWSAKSATTTDRGVSGDQWATTRVIRYVEPAGRALIIRGRMPSEYPPLRDQRLTVWCDEQLIARRELTPGPFAWRFDLPQRTRHATMQVRIHASKSFVPKQLGLNGDIRRLAYYLGEVAITDTGETRPPAADR